MDGRVPTEMLDPAAVAAHPPSATDDGSPGLGPGDPAQAPDEAEGDEILRERLRSLGYIA